MIREEAPDEQSAIRAAWDSGDMKAAVTAVFRTYGSEVFGFLVALHKDVDDADDAFSMFGERLWRTFPSFEWKCSVRTWAYLLARHASANVRRGEARRGRHAVPLSEVPEALELATRIRTETLTAMRTEKRSALQRMRDELPEEDRMLLVLRVDRQLAWRDVARVLSTSGETDGDRALDQNAARLRKRFQIVRDRLRALGKERGLI